MVNGPVNTFLRLFVQGIDNKIYENHHVLDWSGWGEVPGDGLTLSGPAAVLDGGLVRLFVRGLDNRVYTTYRSLIGP
ncbi:MAG: hypothetical protein KGL32_06850 [candidate division NC10 bacterium]|nr:hypothetical protein [candidate division NC10 bacterium]